MTDKAEKDRKWEQVQIKAFTSWFNSVLAKRDMRVEDIKTDLRDGVALLSFLEISSNKKMYQSWNKKPQMRVHMIENQSIAIQYITNELKIRLVGIGAEDLVDGHLKLILGLLWSMFRRMNIENISEEGKSSEDGLLLWIQKMTSDYDHVNVKDFKDSFSDGMAFSALIHKFDPTLIDYDALTPASKEENLIRAFQIAEERLGIPKLLEVEDMIRGGPHIDERSVILYSSLFFHAFVADEQRRAMAGETTKVTSKLQEVQTALEQALARNTELESELQRVRDGQLAEQNARIAELEKRIAELTAEVSYLRERSLVELELRAMLEDKVSALQALIDQTSEERASSDEERAKLRSEIQELRSRSSKLKESLESAETERVDLVSTNEERERRLRELEERKNRLAQEIQELRDRVALETSRRLEKSAECERLKKEIQTLRVKEIVQSKARVGLDLLRRNLEEHLEDLYRWREVSDNVPADAKPSDATFDLSKVVADLSGRPFEAQLDYLDGQLQQENALLRRIVTLKDSQQQLDNTVLKEGALTMKGRKEWRRRWFKLVGSHLNYYEDESAAEASGSISLDQGCEVVRQKAVKDDAGPKKLWPLKITIGDRKLFVKAATKKERHAWFLALTSKIAHLNYVRSCETAAERPDTRLVQLFAAERCTELHLDHRPLSLSAVNALAKGLPGRDEIETLSLQSAAITDESAVVLNEVFEKMSFKSLDLSGNGLSSNAAVGLAKALSALVGLEELRLANNHIDDAGATALAALFATNPNLSVLDLSGNNVSADGAAAVAKAAAGATKLRAVQLNNNSIGDAGAAAVADLLRANHALNAVHLASNSISDAGAEAIAAALAAAPNVSTVDLADNQIASTGAVALKNAFATNSELSSINLSGNKKLVSGAATGELLVADGLAFPNLSIARAL